MWGGEDECAWWLTLLLFPKQPDGPHGMSKCTGRSVYHPNAVSLTLALPDSLVDGSKEKTTTKKLKKKKKTQKEWKKFCK